MSSRDVARIVFGMVLIIVALGGTALVIKGARPDGSLSTAAADGGRGIGLLSSAARTGNLDEMRDLLDRGADPNLADAAHNRWIPLMHAVHKHQLEAVRLLLERGAAPDGPRALRVTPLMMAVGSGQVEVAVALLDKGADPMRRTPGHGSMLTLAVAGGALTDIDEPLLGGCYPAMVKLLIDRAPLIRFDDGLQEVMARLVARLNGCRESLSLIRGRS